MYPVVRNNVVWVCSSEKKNNTKKYSKKTNGRNIHKRELEKNLYCIKMYFYY